MKNSIGDGETSRTINQSEVLENVIAHTIIRRVLCQFVANRDDSLEQTEAKLHCCCSLQRNQFCFEISVNTKYQHITLDQQEKLPIAQLIVLIAADQHQIAQIFDCAILFSTASLKIKRLKTTLNTLMLFVL
jgi:hypothetical protein